ncbi:MAG: Rpp14/Pop5 family protein [Candidatus Freyarchaeota archaeon]
MKLYRNRYIAFKIISETTFSADVIVNGIWRMLLNLFGEVGASRTNFWLIEYSPETGEGILRCTHTCVDMMKATLAAINELNESPLIINALGVSGTIKGVRRFFEKGIEKFNKS